MPMRGLARECMMRSVVASRLPRETGGAARRETAVVRAVVDGVVEWVELDLVEADLVEDFAVRLL